MTELIRTNVNSILNVPVFASPQAVSRKLLLSAGCSTRGVNALSDVGYLGNTERLQQLTFGDLFSISGIGIKSAVSVARAFDAAVPFGAELSATGTPVDSEVTFLKSEEMRWPRATLASLERIRDSDSADLVFCGDLRFGGLIPVGGDSLSSLASGILDIIGGQIAEESGSLGVLPVDPRDPDATGAWASSVEKRLKAIELEKLEPLLANLLATHSGLQGARLDAVIARLGWAGRKQSTLDAAGRSLSITRERMRQIEAKVRDRLPSPPLLLPSLLRAVEELARAAPLEISKAAQLLADRGISTGPFSPESVLHAASDLGIDVPFTIASAKGLTMVVSIGKSEHTTSILRIARKRAGSSGAVSAVDVAARVTLAEKAECKEDEVLETLSASPAFGQLTHGWYWATDLPARRNRLVNVCRRMLSVTAPISVARLRDGLRREYKHRNITDRKRYDLRVPPAEVIRQLLHKHPDFEVEGEMVSPKVPLDYRQELGEFERILVAVLHSNPSGVLDRGTIVQECAKRGAHIARVQTELTYSPLVEHVDLNIWAARGANIDPAAVEALRKSNAIRPKETRIHDFGWTPDGQLWIAARVPPKSQQPVIGCPGGASDFLKSQKFAAFTNDGIPCGTIGVTGDGVAYGYAPYLRLVTADPGDILVTEFDLENRKAVLSSGGSELLEQFTQE